MEANEDMVVVIIGDGDVDGEAERQSSVSQPIKIKEEKLEEADYIQNLIEKAEEHGEYLEGDYLDVLGIKKEELQNEYTENGLGQSNEEYLDDNEYLPDDNDYLSDDDYIQDDGNSDSNNDNEIEGVNKYSAIRGMPSQRTSFITEWRKKHPELEFNKKELIQALVNHMRSMKPPPTPKDYFIMEGINFACIYCGDITETLPAAGRHYQVKHGQRYLKCYSCGVDFRSTTNFYKHEKRCPAPDAITVLKARAIYLGRKGRGRPFQSSAASQIQVQRNSSGSKQRTFLCESCPAMFQTAAALDAHTHLHSGVRPYACNHCHVRYTSASTLSRHLKKHTNIAMICDHCGRSFKIKAALVAHMYTHEPERKYPCTECDRRFAQKAALHLHVNRVHRGLPLPFACEICTKRCPRMSVLKKHMNNMHGMQLMTRNMFFKALPKMSDTDATRHAKVIFKSNEGYANPSNIGGFANMNQIKPFPQKTVHKTKKKYHKTVAGQEMEQTGLKPGTLGQKTYQLGQLGLIPSRQEMSHSGQKSDSSRKEINQLEQEPSKKQNIGQLGQKLSPSRQEVSQAGHEPGSPRQEMNKSEQEPQQSEQESDQIKLEIKDIKKEPVLEEEKTDEREFQIIDNKTHTAKMKYGYVNGDAENEFIVIQDGEVLDLNDEVKQQILHHVRSLMDSDEETVLVIQEEEN